MSQKNTGTPIQPFFSLLQTWTNRTMKFTKTRLSLSVVVVTILPIATLMVTLRFVATRRAKRTPGLEDWFSLCAWAVLVVHDVAMLIGTVLPSAHPRQYPSRAHALVCRTAAGEDPGASAAEAIAQYPETFAVQLKVRTLPPCLSSCQYLPVYWRRSFTCCSGSSWLFFCLLFNNSSPSSAWQLCTFAFSAFTGDIGEPFMVSSRYKQYGSLQLLSCKYLRATRSISSGTQ